MKNVAIPYVSWLPFSHSSRSSTLLPNATPIIGSGMRPIVATAVSVCVVVDVFIVDIVAVVVVAVDGAVAAAVDMVDDGNSSLSDSMRFS